MADKKHIVFYSGGAGSYATAKRVVDKHGKDNTILLFTDTKTEDPDLYRFINETALLLGCEMVWLEDGRDIWEVFKDARFLGNSRIAPCTHILKQKTAKKWIKDNFTPEDCVLYLGIDWTEEHRTKAPRKNWAPYQVEFPLCEEPFIVKQDILDELTIAGIATPYLYTLGFEHNNCGAICVKAGQGHWIKVLEKLPERYAEAERKEEEMRQFLDADVSILKRVRNKQQQRLTLRQLREEHEAKSDQIDMFDIGGCGCFAENDMDMEDFAKEAACTIK